MLELPRTTEINKALSKKALFDKFKVSAVSRKRFDEQINRLAIIAEISPQTANIAASATVSAVYVICLTLKTADCDKQNIALLSKLIDQRMLFVLQYEDAVRLSVSRDGQVIVSEPKPSNEWHLKLNGQNIEAVWENIIADVGDIELAGGKDLDAVLAEKERREKLINQIAAVERRARMEKQPRRKWDYAEELKRLKMELGGSHNE